METKRQTAPALPGGGIGAVVVISQMPGKIIPVKRLGRFLYYQFCQEALAREPTEWTTKNFQIERLEQLGLGCWEGLG